MKYIDISWPITPDMTTYKDRKQVMSLQTKRFACDGVEESCLIMGVHTGTHVDAPAHMIDGGATSEALTPDMFCGRARVLDFSSTEITTITADLLATKEISDGDIILLKTTNSALGATAPFNKTFVALDASGAQYLKDKNVKAVGVDYLGIERGQSDHATHRTLLQNNIGIIEGLRLKEAAEQAYMLLCLPLALHGLDGSPARAVLLEDQKTSLF